jgi:hypothetical protein
MVKLRHKYVEDGAIFGNFLGAPITVLYNTKIVFLAVYTSLRWLVNVTVSAYFCNPAYHKGRIIVY